MLTTTLRALFKRDLEKLKNEIGLYRDEKNIWRAEGGITNPAGNLCLHLVGNLNTYIGANLGNTGYIRNRDQEFSLKDISRTELILNIEKTIVVVQDTLLTLTDDQLKKEYPWLVWEEKTSTEFLLVHLATHLSYHLGQVNYHRRLIDGKK
jgi:uncharacterized damage-inducible protein DinB